jgi:hypothetical protein
MLFSSSDDCRGLTRIDKSTSKNKDKQRSTKHTHKTKDRVAQTSLKTWSELSTKMHC